MQEQVIVHDTHDHLRLHKMPESQRNMKFTMKHSFLEIYGTYTNESTSIWMSKQNLNKDTTNRHIYIDKGLPWPPTLGK